MADTIRELLVGLGFKIDDAGERRFTQALEGAVLRANLLADAIENMASIAVDKIGAVSTQFEQLYYQSQRIHASEVSIRAFGFAISQVGGHVENANASLQGFGDFLAKTPKAAEAIAHQLNIPLKDTADTGKFLLEIYEKLSHKDRAFADPFREAYHLGDDETFLAGRRKDAQGFYDKEKGREEESGIGPSTSKQAIELQQQWRTFAQSMDDYFIQAETNLSKHVANGFESLNHYIDEHHKKISEFVEWSTNLGFIADVKNSGPVHFDEKKFGEHFQTALGAAETAVVNELHVFEGALGPVVRWFERFGRAISNFFFGGGASSDGAGGSDSGALGGFGSGLFNKAKRALGYSTAPSGIQARAMGGKPEGKEADLAKQAYDYWRKEGLTHDQALSVLGNERGENGLGSLVPGDSGSAHGQFQWHEDRRQDILKNTGIDIATAGFLDQQKAARWEMENGAGGGHVWKALKNSKGDDGVDVMVNGFERPLDRAGAIATRKGFAARYGRILKDAPPEPPAAAAPSGGHAAAPAGWDKGHGWDALNAQLPTGGSSDNSKSSVVNQHNEIHVTTSDPGAAAAMVGTHLNRTSADIARNTQGAFQ